MTFSPFFLIDKLLSASGLPSMLLGNQVIAYWTC
jgi:hypothetical protein